MSKPFRPESDPKLRHMSMVKDIPLYDDLVYCLSIAVRPRRDRNDLARLNMILDRAKEQLSKEGRPL